MRAKTNSDSISQKNFDIFLRKSLKSPPPQKKRGGGGKVMLIPPPPLSQVNASLTTSKQTLRVCSEIGVWFFNCVFRSVCRRGSLHYLQLISNISLYFSPNPNIKSDSTRMISFIFQLFHWYRFIFRSKCLFWHFNILSSVFGSNASLISFWKIYQNDYDIVRQAVNPWNQLVN